MKVFILLLTFATVANAGLLSLFFGNNRYAARRQPVRYRSRPPPSIELIETGHPGHSSGAHFSSPPQTIKIIHEHLPSNGLSHSDHDTGKTLKIIHEGLGNVGHSNAPYSGYGGGNERVIKIIKEYGGHHQNSVHNIGSTDQVIKVIKDQGHHHSNYPDNSIGTYAGHSGSNERIIKIIKETGSGGGYNNNVHHGAREHVIKVVKEHGNGGAAYLPPNNIDTHSHGHEQVIHLIKEHGSHSHNGYSSGNGHSEGHEQIFKIIKEHGSNSGGAYPGSGYGGQEQVINLIKENNYPGQSYGGHSSNEQVFQVNNYPSQPALNNAYLPPVYEENPSVGQEQVFQVIKEHGSSPQGYSGPSEQNFNDVNHGGYSGGHEQIFQVINEHGGHSDSQQIDHNPSQEKIIRLIDEGNQINSQAPLPDVTQEVKTLQVLQGSGQLTNGAYDYSPPATEWSPSNWTH